jgi:nucleotide-binding universal stress UspA family protein
MTTESATTTPSIPIKKKGEFVIIHATDLLPDAQTALEHSIAIARETGARLISLHASKEEAHGPRPNAEPILARWPEGKQAFEHHVLIHENSKSPRSVILKSMQEHGADLLIVGTRQYKDEKLGFRSSVSEVAALDGNIPTLVVHVGEPGLLTSEGELRVRRVLLPVGDGEEARDAINGLSSLLNRLEVSDVDIFLFRVGDDEILEYISTPEKKGWRWHRETRRNVTIADGVARACKEKDIDLVVMATRGQDGVIDVLNGTHTQNVIRRTPQPILVVPVQER